MIRERKILVALFVFVLLSSTGCAQVTRKKYNDFKEDYTRALKIASSGNSYEFMNLRKYLGGINMMIKRTSDNELIKQQVNLIDNLIKSSRVSKSISKSVYKQKDGYRGWIVSSANKQNKATIKKETPLFESYSFFYVTEFLYLLKESGWIDQSETNKLWWDTTVRFIEENVWTKWRTRSYNANKVYNGTFLRNRTHMGAHWAGIALYLYEITNRDDIKIQTTSLIQQYDKLLKRNLKLRNGGYVWNSTYDDVYGTDAKYSNVDIIQDVSHGNHVISYVVAAHELGNKNWSEKDIFRFCKTITEIVYNKDKNLFFDNVDGSNDKSRPGWGNFIADGWIKLAEYDPEVYVIMRRFQNSGMLRKYAQEFQFKAYMDGH